LTLGGCERAVPADLVVIGRVWTGDSLHSHADAVAIRGDRIVYVGDSAGALRLSGPRGKVMRAAFVAPGFGDSHTHFLDGGVQLASVDLRDASTPQEFTRRIREYAATLRPGEWIIQGMWDHEAWGGTLPDRAWIDSVTPDNPVFVSRLDGHMGLANSVALKLAGLGRNSRDIPGGTIVRRPDGSLSGVLKDEAMGPIYRVLPDPSPAQADSAISRATHWAAAHGVTTLDAVSASRLEYDALLRAQQAGRLVTRVHAYPALAAWSWVAGLPRPTGPDTGLFVVDGVKGFVDGSLGSTTAWFFEPYLDAPAEHGFPTTPPESLAVWIGAADSAGLQVVVHAIGDRANATLLDIYDSVATAHGKRDRRFRIEHAQHLRRADIPRFAQQGVLASMQPYHVADDGRWANKRIDAERSRTTYAFRSLLDAKARLSFGSDWTVAPLDPLLGMQAAVTRQTLDGKHPEGWVPEERITREEALRAYTGGVAYAHFREGQEGIIRPGMLADLVLLDRDITADGVAIDQARIVATVLGGRVVYLAPAAVPEASR
jgi:predicted amidohydrolase YtcJ